MLSMFRQKGSSGKREGKDIQAMGGIIFWAIVRMVVVIPAIWIMQGMFQSQYWWLIAFCSIYLIVIHPVLMQFRTFEEKNREVLQSTLCSTCKNFDKTAVLCIKYDQHPTRESLPCEGIDWEPITVEHHEEKEYNEEG